MNLTDEQIADLAKLERDMDTEAQPYVMLAGSRWPFPGDLLKDAGIQSGQTVSREIIISLQRKMLAKIRSEKAG